MYKKLKQENSQIARVHFDSLSEMVEQAMDRNSVSEESLPVWQDTMNGSGALSWRNGYTVARAQSELNTPPASSARVSEIVEEIESKHEFMSSRRRLARRREEGDELNAGSWARRELDGWDRMERTATSSMVIRVCVNLAMACNQKPADLYYRGAAAVALADALEAAGHSVEITAVCCLTGLDSGSRGHAIIETTVKQPDSPMDVDTLSLICSEIGFHRTIDFLSYCSVSRKKVSGSLGTPSMLPEAERKKYDVMLDKNVCNLHGAMAVVERYAKEFEA